VQHVRVERRFAAPPSEVFAYLAEHENLEPLFGTTITRVRDGDDGSRNGVGSTRRLKIAPVIPAFEETTTELVPDSLIRYRITKGTPLREHEGLMRFFPDGTGTRLEYEISFGSVVPGVDRVVAAALRRSIPRGLDQAKLSR
jgi:uncharacterized protein YndB with AHSA1/START domain